MNDGASPPAATVSASPLADPDFQAVVTGAADVAAAQRGHAPATAKAAEAQAAAREPAAAIESKAQARKVDQMEGAPVPAFDGAAFKAALMKRISEMAPKNLKEADELASENKLGGIKDEMGGKVKEEKAGSAGPLADATSQPPNKAGIEAKSVTALPRADAGPAPSGIGAERAVPKPRPSDSVELPLQRESAALDEQMADARVTDEQLANSNEPSFKGALKSKAEAASHAADDPAAYRGAEGSGLKKAESDAAAAARSGLMGMYADRGKALGGVAGQQTRAQTRDEAARAKVAADIQGIYEASKTKVESILNGLDAKVEAVFDAGSAAARKTFEDYVSMRMTLYKAERYGDWDGPALWIRDQFMDLPAEVNRFYEEGRALYLKEMDRVIDLVILVISADLAAAKAEIGRGKAAIGRYVAGLPGDLADVGRQAAGEMNEKFSELEQSVAGKQDALIDLLAGKYQQNVQALDERITELKEANKGFISKARDAIKGVIETIEKLRKLLNTVLKRIAEVVGLILADPIGFFSNLIAGLRLGFDNFVANIEKHLLAGLFTWLTGTLGPMNIKMPDDIFSLKGIFSLVMQVLGLTWDYMRAKAVGLFGEKVVAAMETGVKIFQLLMQGPAAVWEHIKEEFNDLKEKVIDQVKEMIATEVIKAGVKWLLGMLNPVSAFIKAAMAIYEIITFIVDRATQIAEFIIGLMDAIAAIAKGQIDGAAAKVESSLARSVPLIIGMLASLLGISGLVKRVQKVIEKIRARIDAAITKLLMKAKALVGKVVGKVAEWWKERKSFKTDKGETHSLYFAGDGDGTPLMIASTPTVVKSFLDRTEKAAGNNQTTLAVITKARGQLQTIEKLQALPKAKRTDLGAEYTNAIDALVQQLLILLNDPGTRTYKGAKKIDNKSFVGTFEHPEFDWTDYETKVDQHPANKKYHEPNIGPTVAKPKGSYSVAGDGTTGARYTTVWQNLIDRQIEKRAADLMKSMPKLGPEACKAQATQEIEMEHESTKYIDLKLTGWEAHHIHPINWGGADKDKNYQYLRKAQHNHFSDWFRKRKKVILDALNS